MVQQVKYYFPMNYFEIGENMFVVKQKTQYIYRVKS